MRFLESRDEPGHRDRARADVEDLRRGVAEVDDDLVHLSERTRRRGEEAIEHGRLAVEPREQEAAARGAGQRAFGDGCGKRGYDARVDCIAAFRENVRACFGGDLVSRGDRSLHELRVKVWRRCR